MQVSHENKFICADFVVAFVQLIGWLLKRPQNSDVVFGTFEKIWEDLYHYVVQDLNPKMDVSIELYDYLMMYD